MSDEQTQSVLRIRKRHPPGEHETPTVEDGARLIRAQSIRQAVMAALIVITVFTVLWSMLSSALDELFPWMTLLLGILVGLAVRRAGLGLDWRFPAIAAVFTLFGALIGNIVVAATFSARELGTSAFTVLGSMSSFTLPVFFDEVVTPADIIFGGFAAVIAAFYAKRKLSRRQFHALRVWENENGPD